MQNRTFFELFALVESLSGVFFADIERPRIKSLINRRAARAYRATNYWPRFLKIGEERAVVVDTVAYNEGGKEAIDTYLRIHARAPYISTSAQEYGFMVTADGAKLVSGNTAPTTVFVTYKMQFSEVFGDGFGEFPAIPAEWYQYMAHGTYADYLRAEGQQEKAVIADQEAESLLQDEMIRIDEQNTTQIIATRISTNANMQTRY